MHWSIRILSWVVYASVCLGAQERDPVPDEPMARFADTTTLPAQVEAICQNGAFYRTRTSDIGSSRHPFALMVPQGEACQFSVSTYSDIPGRSRYVSLRFRDRDRPESSIVIATHGRVELGQIAIAIDPESESTRSDSLTVMINPSEVILVPSR